MTNLATFLVHAARQHGGRVAVRESETVLTYAELDDASARMAALLHADGVRPGDRVALAMPNITSFPVAYYGVLRAGAVVVPMNPLLKAREIAFVLRDSGARTVVTSPMSAGKPPGPRRRPGPSAWSRARRRSMPRCGPCPRSPGSATGRRATQR